ncbi:OmpH family outer membrane protein [Thalassotalea euphylliae]|uniref:OmpH family outer membrane protein n=1 Tax=Thalassotalea euphylliae TaxID=1655234 RepID=UPI00363DFE7E
MKKFIKSLAVTTAASTMLLAGSAMAEKFGVVNYQRIQAEIPQTAQLAQTLDEEFKDDRAVLEQLKKDVQYFQEKLKRDSSLMTEKEKEDVQKQVAAKFQEYQTKGQELQQKAQVRQRQETGKILALIRQAIDNIAAKDNYDFVFEQSAVPFNKPEHDITDKVVEQVSKLK